MNPFRHLVKPFHLLLAAELALVAGLGLVSWHVWQSRSGPAPTAAGLRSEGAGRPSPRHAAAPAPAAPAAVAAGLPSPLARAPAPPSPRPGATPGLRTDGGFLSGQMDLIDRDEAAFYALEWRFLRMGMDAVRGYLERGVLPAVERTQRSGP